MNNPGVPNDLLIASRSALLDALEALADHREAVVIVGAQAIYLQTDSAPVALAESTKDSDIALDARLLVDDPLIQEAMKSAGFLLDPIGGQPGAWINRVGVPVDLMVPEALAGSGGKQSRGVRKPPHDRSSMRRAKGLEAAVVDNHEMVISALATSDERRYSVKVAGLAALVVAKTHKIAERIGTPTRLVDKDAHDIYRILVVAELDETSVALNKLLEDPLSRDVTEQSLAHLRNLFAAGPDATGSTMAGRAEEGIGEPATVALAVSVMAAELLDTLK